MVLCVWKTSRFFLRKFESSNLEQKFHLYMLPNLPETRYKNWMTLYKFRCLHDNFINMDISIDDLQRCVWKRNI